VASSNAPTAPVSNEPEGMYASHFVEGTEPEGTESESLANKTFPPIVPLGVAAMALVLSGGIEIAAYLPRRAPLAPAIGLLAAAALCLAGAVILTTRLKPFAWHSFWLVGKWTLLVYVVEAGMLEYVFTYDHVTGAVAVLLTLMLVVFAVDVPLILAFTVARYQSPAKPASEA